MKNLVAKINNHQTESNGAIVYCLEAIDKCTARFKITKLRYSQLLALHQQLENIVNKLKIEVTLPDFPKRKLVGSTNKSQESITARKKQLNQYFQALICIEELHCLQIFKKYFVPINPYSKQHKIIHQNLNIHFSIDRYAIVDDVVIYSVRLRDKDSREEWTFKTRYSQLRNVHTALQASIRYLPPFPKKKRFSITSESPENIEKRREELQKYFNEIFVNKEVLQNEAFTFFIEQSKKQALQAPIKQLLKP